MAGSHAHSHTHGHGHDDGDWGDMAAGPVRAVLTTLVVVALAVTVVGVLVFWPRGESIVDSEARESLGFTDRERAVVVDAADRPCSFDVDDTCHVTTFELTTGQSQGDTASIEHVAYDDTPGGTLDVGDRIIVNDAGAGVDPSVRFSFADVERDGPLWVLLLVFAGAVIVLGRWRGVLALAGLGLSFAVILIFIFPAFLHGSDPVGVAVTGASVIAFATLYLAHGFTMRTTVALLGTFASLFLIAGLAHSFARSASLTGLADSEALDLFTFAPGLDFRGLLLAAIIIGALGVLDDVTVTQTAAVWELRRASPELTARELYSAGVRIGRDHIAATVNTLVLAYTAAALPMLLMISQSGLSLAEALTNETIAVEIVQTLVGSIGLVAAVPITTALAAWVATRSRPDERGDERGDGRPAPDRAAQPVQQSEAMPPDGQPRNRWPAPTPGRPLPRRPPTGPTRPVAPRTGPQPQIPPGPQPHRPRRDPDDDFWSR